MTRQQFLTQLFPVALLAAPIAAAQFTARSLLSDPEKEKHAATAREMYSAKRYDVVTAEAWRNVGRAIEYLIERE